ncbi:hypothetical protein [Nonlabens tegetincola]|uniref:hypothetical protein n=1 Tax=Nonlabens tegetincola TaxID=323273 RepID=UPI000CF4676E|nr:hypothetical protein [Nonlabens tegetincola]PQJ13913.1 hypothetical protein BST93_11650 [Nonlabens tegetincola]PQJ17283.1 hypothetical protein BST93_11600 [Nonlabens tegetincola]
MRLLIVFLLALNSFGLKSQTYSYRTITNNQMMVKGKVGKYPITLYMEYQGFCEYEREYTGWYKYDSSTQSIPIQVYFSTYPENEEFIIYAKYDGDFQLEIDEDYSCHPVNYDEKFYGDSDDGIFNNMSWNKKGSSQVWEVTFEEDVVSKFWDLGEYDTYLTVDDDLVLDFGTMGFEYVYEVHIEGFKEVHDITHMLITVIEPSKPGGNGRGMCGAGDEIYLLYLRLDKQNKLLFSDSEKIQSCYEHMEESPVKYDTQFPERGFKRVK